MRAISFRGASWGSSPDVIDRQLTADDLPRPTTNAQADRTVRDDIMARQRGLLRVSGFGDADATAAAGGASSSGFELGMGSGLGRAVVVGVGVTVGATFAIRLLEKLWSRK